MDEMFERFLRIFPDAKFAAIPKYNAALFEGKEYDSSMDTKAAMNRWRDNPMNATQARLYLESGGRLGWIVPKGYVVVDIDNKEEFRTQEYVERLLKKFEVQYNFNYTSKGIHLLFQDPTKKIGSGAKYKTSLNLIIDTRANGTGYIILPCNDPHRSWGTWNEYVEELPYFLKPTMVNDTTPTFIGMSDGDGRNDALYRWRMKLEEKSNLTPEEIEKSIRIINENLFEIGMPNKELYATVLRHIDKKQVETKRSAGGEKIPKSALYNEIANQFIQKNDIVCFGTNIYRFNGVYYELITELDLERYIHFDFDQTLGTQARKEIIRFIVIKTQVTMEQFDKDWYKIACGNGILNLVTGEITAPTKNDINTIYIPWNYDPDPPESPRIDEFMKDLCNGDLLKIQFLYQIAGYCLLKKNLFEKFFIFRGEGGTGKSTYLNLLQRLVGGDRNCSHIGLQDFDKDYFLASTISKLLNVDDDAVDGKTLESTGRFKSFVSGNAISVRQIYKDVVNYVPYATCVFSCNRLPKLMDKTTGLLRRMILVELNNKVIDPDPLFLNKVTTTDMEYFLFKAVEGIKEAIEEGRFKINRSEKNLLTLFRRRQSSINEWLFDNNLTTGDFHMKRTMEFYKEYCEWCVQNGYQLKVSHYSFREEICGLYDLDVDYEEPAKSITEVGRKQIFIKRGMFDSNYKPF